jgi:hypothetical protein
MWNENPPLIHVAASLLQMLKTPVRKRPREQAESSKYIPVCQEQVLRKKSNNPVTA